METYDPTTIQDNSVQDQEEQEQQQTTTQSENSDISNGIPNIAIPIDLRMCDY